jgi:glycerol kinase
VTAVLSIDQGTSGTKAAVVRLDPSTGALIAEAVAEETVRPRYFDGGGVEQDPEELWESVLAAGHRAIQAADTPIAAIALANQGETVLAWDRASGDPVSRAVVWQDRRAAEVCADLSDQTDEVAKLTGLVLDPYFSAPKMAWLRRHVTHDGVVTTTDSWLLYRLTGAFVTDVTTASRSLLADLDGRSWHPGLVELFGLADEPLPEIVDCDTVVGNTTVFGGHVPVAGQVVDQQAALLAEGCFDAGTAKCTYGTGAFLLANTGDRGLRSASGLTASVAWTAAGQTRYCIDGQVYTAASAVRWLQQLGFIGHAADLDTVAADDAGGVLCVPALAGLAAPWWRPDATASFTGMTLATETGHLVLAVLQGIAAQVAELGRLVQEELGAPLSALRSDGGLTQSATLMQAQADLLQIPVEIYPSPHATLLGAAALARLAMEPGLNLGDAVGTWRPTRVYVPAWSADRAAEFRARWLDAAAHT